ncbi:hypothetical protein E6R18_32840 [Streptomyces sp. A1277]|uniref:hypothetical protein n=1 Tax=Streptomyces sp. A1277 TaxID=2563103 RepID=UPI0010A22F5D|nr:hypothetical protein [Streptomyces sp. A1277]THA22735.1 hypothetical protein E6R18_32840 [Streptomyces sp. A1277]
MSILTIALDALDNPHDPDHIRGRADAYDALHDGTSLTTLDDRLAWMDDPTVSGTTYTAAYLSGYRAQLRDWTTYDHAQRVAITHNAWETTR